MWNQSFRIRRHNLKTSKSVSSKIEANQDSGNINNIQTSDLGILISLLSRAFILNLVIASSVKDIWNIESLQIDSCKWRKCSFWWWQSASGVLSHLPLQDRYSLIAHVAHCVCVISPLRSSNFLIIRAGQVELEQLQKCIKVAEEKIACQLFLPWGNIMLIFFDELTIILECCGFIIGWSKNFTGFVLPINNYIYFFVRSQQW